MPGAYVDVGTAKLAGEAGKRLSGVPLPNWHRSDLASQANA